jgi:hypothetical protein
MYLYRPIGIPSPCWYSYGSRHGWVPPWDAGELGVLLVNKLGTFESVVLRTLLAVALGTSDAGECVAEQNSLDLA